MQRFLVLANGSVYPGTAFGGTQPVTGEIVFTTGMTGYQEAITDASYHHQILTFTYPLIGNYGINLHDNEAHGPQASAIVVHEVARRPSNWRCDCSLADWAATNDLPGITDVDTRAITRELREAGVMNATIVDQVTPTTIEQLQQPLPVTPPSTVPTITTSQAVHPYRIGVLDFGLKRSILRALQDRGVQTVVFPPTTNAATILASGVDGILLSNGPGDPTAQTAVLPTIRALQARLPLMAICLGHQLFALANGARTFKLKFGHRGFNHAVRDLAHGTTAFTAQNHGYAVDPQSLAHTNLTVTHVEITDHTIEGLKLRDHAAFSVQFHPDATPGPHDYGYLFDDFIAMIRSQHEAKEALHAQAQ
ncbi:carbamoyl phosphate synthase small subunit [Lacticaseibacillus thailandensis]|uniref:Carbamoyl phosphate synthase small chain n=1 Tax=Lacticaseibacillus thailandensis DSM 22698 = JCM 13996 TaxID=1423810 RepID=A0A0R2CEM2_9LACO|nr:carbamoyl phosphate synthase small subunit [Lacticaseibacillus thailandensis]KRM86841.1 carbamoyl-phosphate synthase small subunit [Lacticaseibacillus thailandensis DSM 22698 = JCM 13996]